MNSSTVRSAFEPTINEYSANQRQASLLQIINTEWRESGRADLVVAMRRHPLLLRERSLLLNLAIEEYRANCRAPEGADLERHCHRFREFGSSIQRSILRQLEAQLYLDGHPELLELLSAPNWPIPGEKFGRFHVCEELGFGAAAHVYLCLEADIGHRQVVVKATPYSSIEASVLGRLRHPNIIPIYSTGSVDECNLHYLCMPYCGRSTFADLLDVAFQDGLPRRDDCLASAASRWTVDEEHRVEKRRRGLYTRFRRGTYIDAILSLAVQVADALEHAHKQGILHGDLKPSNLLLTPDVRPLLLDFNLSQDYASSPGMCGGTLPYMPPEHLRLVAGRDGAHDIHVFDGRSDIYSFGALLYELLSGAAPVNLPGQADDSSAIAKVLLRQLEQGVASIRERNPFVSRRLESIVLECLAFDPGSRPATMTRLKNGLQGELRSMLAVGRMARVRPVFFSAVVGLPLAVATLTGTHFALRPARFLVNYQEGLRLASAGEFDEAANHFTAAARSNPSFAAARFELGRTRIALGKLDLALDDFDQLARTVGDAHSMAYAGYCFNLKGLPVAAIPWYERAIENGAKSAAIYNNLGASYLDAQSHLPKAEGVLLAEDCLFRAHKLDRTSITVKLNIIRLAIARSTTDPKYDPFGVWTHAMDILDAAPDDHLVRSQIAAWYSVIIAREAAVNVAKMEISSDQVSARRAFDRVYRMVGGRRADSALEPESVDQGGSSPARFLFLEPI
jgi:eukaryotic-like serine/threonine-protein kinase